MIEPVKFILSNIWQLLHDVVYKKLKRIQSPRPHFYQTRSAWSKDQGSNENNSPVHNFAPTVTKCCVMWEGQALPQDTKFGNCRDKIVDSRAFLSWSLILGSSWSGLIKVGPGGHYLDYYTGIISYNQVTATTGTRSSSEFHAVDFIYGYPILKWVAMKWQVWEGTSAVATHLGYLTNPNNVVCTYFTMHHFATEMCTHVHIYVTKRCIVGYGTDAL